VKRMKRWLIAVIVILSLVGYYGSVKAKVQGICSDCHTMHSSQTPSPTVWEEAGWTAGTTNGALVVGGCIGCHSGDSPRRGASNEIPVVLRTQQPDGTGNNKSLAGGDFWWVASSGGNDDTKGHNVKGLANIDQVMSNNGVTAPPGWDTNCPGDKDGNKVANGASTWGFDTDTQLTCAGTYGCHGKHGPGIIDDYAAIRGAHHGDDSCLKPTSVNEGTQGSTVAASYRFLYGIHGIEDNDWEFACSETDHNQYKGVNGNSSYSDRTTISYLCAECHGLFHDQSVIGTQSPWLRHPTDFDLGSASTDEYKYYNGGSGAGNNYSVIAPVASSDLSQGILSTVNPGSADGTAIVICLSCHRAHGSEYPDLLRWCYNDMVAGQQTTPNEGCFICHTTK